MSKIVLEGNVDDHLCVSPDHKLKTIRLINLIDDTSNYTFEIVSESEFGDHKIIDDLLGKKISIEVKVLD